MKHVRIAVAAALVAALLAGAGCSAKSADSGAPAKDAKADYKIGVVSPAFSASEDEYRGGEKVVAKYGKQIKHLVLPEDFTAEQETAMSQIEGLAADPQVKAIVIAAGYTGILPAIQKIKEQRPDMKVITAPIWDDPDQMAKYIDLALDTDAVKRGINIVDKSQKMGAKTLIHYSFQSHMAKELLAQRRDVMKAEAEKRGMKFVFIMTPDPNTEADGAMQQFLKEDLPKQFAKYGKDTAVFGSNCGMQDVIIAEVMKAKAIMPEQCCPTPTQGYPAALGIEVPAKGLDTAALNEQIKAKVAEGGNAGRMSTWPIPLGVFFPEYGVEVAKAMVEDGFDGKDPAKLAAMAEKVAGVPVSFDKYMGKDNYYMIIMDSVYY
ncbi:MAG: DUF3798 domain-containing protein [Coriobacteriia bacterium]|nr:DUF3798 domain-containing protein [Coriobacteriia bacterium]